MLKTQAQVLLIGLLGLTLTACGQPEPIITTPPAELRTCADDPAAPSLPAIDWTSVETARPIVMERGRMTLDYILGLRTSGGDCRAKVVGLDAWVREVE